MKRLLIALACLVFCAVTIQSVLAQSADEPASKDDVILYLRTMHSHDMMRRVLQVQSQNIQELMKQQFMKDKGQLPAGFEDHFAKAMADLVQNMPVDQMTELMIPAYQRHFTKGDIEAMNAFYSSPVGQKVLQELPAVMQEGSQAAMSLMNNYLTEWRARMENEMADLEKQGDTKPAQPGPTSDK